MEAYWGVTCVSLGRIHYVFIHFFLKYELQVVHDRILCHAYELLLIIYMRQIIKCTYVLFSHDFLVELFYKNVQKSLVFFQIQDFMKCAFEIFLVKMQFVWTFNEFNMSMETFLACNVFQLIVNMNIVKLSQNLHGVWKFVCGKHFASRHQGS